MESPLFRVVSKLKRNSSSSTHHFRRRDDDVADHLNHTVTSAVLIACTVVVSARQYAGGKAIACWVPSEFTRAQEEYAESVCWVSSTYFISPYTKQIPVDIIRRDEAKLLYYQWVPFLLMLQTILFNIPCLFWRLVSWHTGIHLSTIMEISSDIDNIRDHELRHLSISYLSRLIEQSLRQHHVILMRNRNKMTATTTTPSTSNYGSRLDRISCLFWFSHRYGSFLTSLYFCTKFLYLVNIFGQFFLMAKFLDSNYTFYGLELLRHLVTGYTWQESGNFPRITMCDFEIRKLANIQRYTVQCVLPINMFNEKIFLFLWFWFVFIACATLISCLSWSVKLCVQTSRIRFVRKFLKLKSVITPADMKHTIEFTIDYLRFDGVLVLRLLSENVGDLITADIVEKLWRQWCGLKSGCGDHSRLGTDAKFAGFYSTIHPQPGGTTDEVVIGNHSRRPRTNSSMMVHHRGGGGRTTSSQHGGSSSGDTSSRDSQIMNHQLFQRSGAAANCGDDAGPVGSFSSKRPTAPLLSAEPTSSNNKSAVGKQTKSPSKKHHHMKGIENKNLENLEEEDPGEFV